MSQIFAFGDSITWGSLDPNGGWADILKQQIISDPDSVVYNLGIPSNRTDQLLKRFNSEVDSRYNPEDGQAYFIFHFGANDAAFRVDQQIFRVDIEEYTNNIRKVVALARAYSNNIVFLTITPVDESKTDGVRNPLKSRKNEYVDKYNQALVAICQEEKIDTLDVNAAFKQQDPIALLCPDGLHPNSAGHQVILSLVKQYLSKKLQLS